MLALLHSYRNPAHEREAERLIGQWAPRLPVFCSSDVWPIIREYERTATATIHGYVQPRVARYLTALQAALKQAGVAAEAMVTKSNGGVMTAELGKSACLQMLLSGTAAGVIGAGFVARQAGLDKVLSLDIGGTSADVALIVDGTPHYGIGELIGDFPIYIPTVSVTSIGDGGGSIASVSEFGMLTVGPESAGSTPGPACYGRGGARPTMTDAFAVCGVIGHGNIGYDAVAVDVEKARAAVGTIAGEARPRARSGRRSHHPGGGLGHVPRGRQARLAPGHRPARLHAAGVRRRRTDAGLLPGARTRHAPGADPRPRRACSRRWADWSPTSRTTSSARSTTRCRPPSCRA